MQNPFSNLTQARDYIRTLKANGENLSNGSEIILREGTYIQNETLVLAQRDCDISFRTYGTEKASVCGGTKILLSDFNLATDSRLQGEVVGKVYKINFLKKGIKPFDNLCITGHSQYYLQQAGISSGGTTPTVYFNEEMMNIARYPNKDYMKINQVIQSGNLQSKTPMSFTVADERINKWSDEKDAWVFGYWYYDWSDQSAAVESIDISTKTITTTIPSAFSVRNGQRFYIYNMLCELDEPGEWFYDKKSGDLYVYPKDTQNSSSITLAFDDCDIINMQNASNIEFCGIDFSKVRKNAICAKNSNYIKVENCTISNVGAVGISISGTNNNISHNNVYEVGAGGIHIAGGNLDTLSGGENVVLGNKVNNFGKMVKTYSAGIECGGVGNVVSDNIIHTSPHCAIILSGNDNQITNNEIYNVLMETADSGAVYMGRSTIRRGNLVNGNNIHNINSNSAYDGQYAIYLDDCFSGTTINNNKFSNIKGSGVFINGGRDNEVSNNSFDTISQNGIRFSVAGRTNWYGNDEEFVNMLGLAPQTHTTIPYLKYPHLCDILKDSPRDAKYNQITSNTFTNCIGDKVFLDTVGTTVTKNDMRKMNIIEEK